MSSVIPPCPLFGQCGGCQYQDIPYPEELKIKYNQLLELLKPFDIEPQSIYPVLPSPKEYGYRNRLDLKLQRRKTTGEIHIGFSPQGRKNLLIAETCAIARTEISNFIPRLKSEAIAKLPSKYKLANLVVRSGEGANVEWGGIGRHSLRLAPEDYFWTDIQGHRIFYSLETFFQANLFILPRAIDAIRSLPVWSKDAVFFDLYGGVGLFAISFSDLVSQSILIEENEASVGLARYNMAYNRLDHVRLFDGRVEDILPSLLEDPSLKGARKIVMVDPPRAGLSASAIAQLNALKGVDSLMYLSCDPTSLAENLVALKSCWKIGAILPFDFFPRTRHLETFVLLHALA